MRLAAQRCKAKSGRNAKLWQRNSSWKRLSGMANNQPSWMIETADTLTLPTAAGDMQCYRVMGGNIEFQPTSHADWRRLAPTDVLQHVKLKTVVAGWLKSRMAVWKRK